jgi:hypothetical protein
VHINHHHTRPISRKIFLQVAGGDPDSLNPDHSPFTMLLFTGMRIQRWVRLS